MELPPPVGHLHSNGEFCQERAVVAPSWWPIEVYTKDQAAAAIAAAVAEERAKWAPAARRYEIVRRMSVPAFQDAFVLNRRTGKPFDEIIDELAPVYLTAGPVPKPRGKKRPTAPI